MDNEVFDSEGESVLESELEDHAIETWSEDDEYLKQDLEYIERQKEDGEIPDLFPFSDNVFMASMIQKADATQKEEETDSLEEYIDVDEQLDPVTQHNNKESAVKEQSQDVLGGEIAKIFEDYFEKLDEITTSHVAQQKEKPIISIKIEQGGKSTDDMLYFT